MREQIEKFLDADFNKFEIVLNRVYKEKYVKDLEKENEELQERINKIMEIIELNQYNYGYQIKEEILKGEENVKN